MASGDGVSRLRCGLGGAIALLVTSPDAVRLKNKRIHSRHRPALRPPPRLGRPRITLCEPRIGGPELAIGFHQIDDRLKRDRHLRLVAD